MTKRVALFYPSSFQKLSDAPQRLAALQEKLPLDFFPPTSDPQWTWTSGHPRQRADQLRELLFSPLYSHLWAGRGGYGAADLIAKIPYDLLEGQPEKHLVGFSDISALQSALFTKLGWQSLHAPMPLGHLWNLNSREDSAALLKVLGQQSVAMSLSLRPVTPRLGRPPSHSGWLFGGCLSVLSALIGTPFLPAHFRGAVLFFEDIEESFGTVMRMLRQWQLAGLLKGVEAIVVGSFVGKSFADEAQTQVFWKNVEKELELPLYCSPDFGHISPNFPLQLGAAAEINEKADNLRLTYTLSPPQRSPAV